MFKSIRWKFVTIFIMLVLIAIIISGVFIIEFFDQYNLDIVSNRLDDLSELMLEELNAFDQLENQAESVNDLVNRQIVRLGFREEIFVVSGSSILASSTKVSDQAAEDILEFDLLVAGLLGQVQQEIVQLAVDGGVLRVMDKVYPIASKDKVKGVLYLRYDMKDTDETIKRAKIIILQSTIISLTITVVLGFIIARSITGPINDVTEKAFKMARGDFDQFVEVKSDDEIGKLAEMFNHLTRKLKLSLSEISREKNKLEAIVNNMADGLIAVSKHREVLHINPKALEILRSYDIKVTKDYDALVAVLPERLQFAHLIEKHPDWHGSEVMTLAQSTFRVSFEPFENESGEKEGLILVFQNITEHKRLDDMRRDFVANVSHELKTPLTSIKSYTETLLDGLVDEPEMVHQFLTVVNSEADRMGRLVKDLLQLSNFDAKRVHMEFDQHDYVELVQSVLQKMTLHVKQKQHDIQFISEMARIEATFDYHRMEQVMINLISNAIKYTPDGGKITITLLKDLDDVWIKVKDTGVGIEEAHISQIFDRFYRVDKARSRDMGGTGLGLAIAKEIVEYHQGSIHLESEVNIGTTVKLRLPTYVQL